MVIPPPLFAEAFAPNPKVIFLSAELRVVELIVVVVPSTCRLPAITTVPVLSPTVAGSIVREAGPLNCPVVVIVPIVNAPLPNCVFVIEPSGISADVIALFAIFAVVTFAFSIFAVITESEAKCIASMLPDISSAVSTEFAASCVEVILPSGICTAVTWFCAICTDVIALSAISVPAIAFTATKLFVTFVIAILSC